MQRHFAFRGIAAGALLLMAGNAALADPTTLVCGNDTRPDFPAITVDLNEAQHTATVNHPAYTNAIGISSPASSYGPVAANFDPKTITFDLAGAGYEHYTLDRVTAVMRDYFSEGAPYDQAAPQNRLVYQYTCHVGTKQF